MAAEKDIPRAEPTASRTVELPAALWDALDARVMQFAVAGEPVTLHWLIWQSTSQ